MNVEFMLESWLEKKGIDAEKVDEHLFDQVVNRMDDDIDDFVRDNFDKFIDNWGFLIEQELPEHPEWKLTEIKEMGE